ncbi:hypothetical protein ACFC3F_12755 [Microbacterium sp. NPDC055910]|uniref:hypothetical protein n=1 Tax=Microbacterium sp. NPDC055910 TaxID=3345659 RepID=UPI0035D5C560
MSLTPAATTDTATAPSSWSKVAGVVAILIAIIVVFLLAFALPSVNSEPHDIPIAVVGPGQVVTALGDALEENAPGGFEITVADSADDARELILNRDVYGAFIVDPASGLTVDTASAASSYVATILEAAAQQIGAVTSLPVVVDDVVPFPEADPRGIGLSAGALPMALGGWIAAVATVALVRGNRQRLATAGSFAVLGGLALTSTLYFWIGTFEDNFWMTTLGAMLGIAATAFLVLGLGRLLKGVGIAIAAVLLILLGNPLSGLSSAPEVLPVPWGAIGQLLPPGATGTLLRNLGFFDGAATLHPILVLTAWLVLGLAMYAFAVVRDRRGEGRLTE